jgi:hypothetical protein
MKQLIIQPKDEKDKVFLQELLQKLGYESKEIDIEDTYFLESMVSEKKGGYVTKAEILKALRK